MSTNGIYYDNYCKQVPENVSLGIMLDVYGRYLSRSTVAISPEKSTLVFFEVGFEQLLHAMCVDQRGGSSYTKKKISEQGRDSTVKYHEQDFGKSHTCDIRMQVFAESDKIKALAASEDFSGSSSMLSDGAEEEKHQKGEKHLISICDDREQRKASSLHLPHKGQTDLNAMTPDLLYQKEEKWIHYEQEQNRTNSLSLSHKGKTDVIAIPDFPDSNRTQILESFEMIKEVPGLQVTSDDIKMMGEAQGSEYVEGGRNAPPSESLEQDPKSETWERQSLDSGKNVSRNESHEQVHNSKTCDKLPQAGSPDSSTIFFFSNPQSFQKLLENVTAVQEPWNHRSQQPALLLLKLLYANYEKHPIGLHQSTYSAQVNNQPMQLANTSGKLAHLEEARKLDYEGMTKIVEQLQLKGNVVSAMATIEKVNSLQNAVDEEVIRRAPKGKSLPAIPYSDKAGKIVTLRQLADDYRTAIITNKEGETKVEDYINLLQHMNYFENMKVNNKGASLQQRKNDGEQETDKQGYLDQPTNNNDEAKVAKNAELSCLTEDGEVGKINKDSTLPEHKHDDEAKISEITNTKPNKPQYRFAERVARFGEKLAAPQSENEKASRFKAKLRSLKENGWEKIKRATVGPKGKEIKIGSCVIKIPEGALDEDKLIVLKIRSKFSKEAEGIPQTSFLIAPILECSPPTTFNKPVKVSLGSWYSAKEGHIDGNVYYKENKSSKWHVIGKIELGTGHAVNFEIYHFCNYASLVPNDLPEKGEIRIFWGVYVKHDNFNRGEMMFIACPSKEAYEEATESLDENYKIGIARKKLLTAVNSTVTIQVDLSSPEEVDLVATPDPPQFAVDREFLVEESVELYFVPTRYLLDGMRARYKIPRKDGRFREFTVSATFQPPAAEGERDASGTLRPYINANTVIMDRGVSFQHNIGSVTRTESHNQRSSPSQR